MPRDYSLVLTEPLWPDTGRKDLMRSRFDLRPYCSNGQMDEESLKQLQKRDSEAYATLRTYDGKGKFLTEQAKIKSIRHYKKKDFVGFEFLMAELCNPYEPTKWLCLYRKRDKDRREERASDQVLAWKDDLPFSPADLMCTLTFHEDNLPGVFDLSAACTAVRNVEPYYHRTRANSYFFSAAVYLQLQLRFRGEHSIVDDRRGRFSWICNLSRFRYYECLELYGNEEVVLQSSQTPSSNPSAKVERERSLVQRLLLQAPRRLRKSLTAEQSNVDALLAPLMENLRGPDGSVAQVLQNVRKLHAILGESNLRRPQGFRDAIKDYIDSLQIVEIRHYKHLRKSPQHEYLAFYIRRKTQSKWCILERVLPNPKPGMPLRNTSDGWRRRCWLPIHSVAQAPLAPFLAERAEHTPVT